MSEKRRLGKGLGALIPEVLADSADSNEIALDQIRPNPFQPRQVFDDEKLEELTVSIKEHGVLQAVVVSPTGDGSFYLVAGERRCRAAKAAGLSTIPAVIRALDRKTMLEVALIENLQRENLNPIEEARAYKRLIQEYDYTQDELSRRLGKSRPSIANSIRLLSLPDSLLELLMSGELTAGQARPLLAIANPEIQKEAAMKIIREGLSAREAEKIAGQINRVGKKRRDSVGVSSQDPLYAELQAQIQRSMGTKVRLKQGKHGGTIEIYFYSDEDLERLVARLIPDGV